MNRTIKYIILILVFIFISVMAVFAISEANLSAISDDIATLSEIQSQLSSSSGTRSISRVINSVIKRLNSAITQTGPSCVSRLRATLSKLERVAKILAKRKCGSSGRANCIQDDVADQILSRLQNAINDLKEKTSLDSDGNGVPDICSEDPDNDRVLGKEDNCPFVSNPEQKDVDGNGIGDACDVFLCCEDSSLTFPIDQCTRKTIKSCRQEGDVVIGCLGSKKGNPGRESENLISSSPILLNQTSSQNTINFGTGATPSMIMINTGFFPFNNSQGVVQGFRDFNCDDFDITLTPPPGFPGGNFQLGPAANGFETGPRTTVQINGDMSLIIPLNDFPIIDPVTGQPFDPSMSDQLGFSLFVNPQDMTFVNSFFDIFVDLDFDGSCHNPLGSSSGGTSSSGGGVVTTSGGNTSGGTVTTSGGASSGSFVTMLQDAVGMSTVPGMEYMATTYDCDDFAEDLGMDLMDQGYDTTFTAIWMNNGMDGHAVTDVHTTSGGIIFIEPQNGMIIDLDEDMDGMVGYRDMTHSDTTMNTEGMSEIEVYMDRAEAAMAGVPID